MNMTLDEFQTCYRELGKISAQKIHNILVSNGVNGYYLETKPVRTAHQALAMNFPKQERIAADIFQEAMKMGQDTIDRRAWLTWDPQGDYDDDPELAGIMAREDWEYVVSEMQKHIDNTRRTNHEWIIRYVNVGWQNKTGITTITAPNLVSLMGKIFPDTEYSFSVWRSDPKKDNEWYHLNIRLFHHDSPAGESYFIYKPTLKQYNEIRSGKALKEVLEKSGTSK